MIIRSEKGEILTHAWLDGSLIDPGYAHASCRLVLGTRGGVVCDRIETVRPMDEEAAMRLAEHAVIMTDPADPDALPLMDEGGAPASLIPDDLVRGTDRRIVRCPDSEIDLPEPIDGRKFRTMLACIMVTVLAFGAGATVMSIRKFEETVPILPFAIATGHIGIGVWIASVMRRTKRLDVLMMSAWTRLAREMERRRTIPTIDQGDPS